MILFGSAASAITFLRTLMMTSGLKGLAEVAGYSPFHFARVSLRLLRAYHPTAT